MGVRGDRSKRLVNEEKNHSCHDSLQQMCTSATNNADLMHAHKSTATFLSFPLTLSLLPQLLPLSLSLTLSLACSTHRALQTNGACLFRCMDMTTSKTLHAMKAGWEGPWERETTWDEEQCHLASMMAAWLHCLLPLHSFAFLFRWEFVLSPSLISPSLLLEQQKSPTPVK